MGRRQKEVAYTNWGPHELQGNSYLASYTRNMSQQEAKAACAQTIASNIQSLPILESLPMFTWHVYVHVHSVHNPLAHEAIPKQTYSTI